MSQFNAGNSKGYVATAALAEGVAVKLAGGQVVVATSATDKIVGVTEGGPVAAGETGTIRLRSSTGTFKAKIGGTVAVGDFLTSNGTGQLITTTTAGNEIVGRALEAGVSGDFIEAMCTNDRV